LCDAAEDAREEVVPDQAGFDTLNLLAKGRRVAVEVRLPLQSATNWLVIC